MKSMTFVAIPLLALSLLAWPVRSSAAGKAKLLANATVKSLTATSLTVTAEGKDTTIAVDAKTRVIGKGVGTKAAAASKDRKASITDLLGQGDRVTVTYEESGTAMRATRVELIAKSK